MNGCTAICHVGLPVPFLLSSQLPCICADGKVMTLIGAQMDEDNHETLDIEVSSSVNDWLHLANKQK